MSKPLTERLIEIFVPFFGTEEKRRGLMRAAWGLDDRLPNFIRSDGAPQAFTERFITEAIRAGRREQRPYLEEALDYIATQRGSGLQEEIRAIRREWHHDPTQLLATAPYKGLEPYTESDQAYFFGRQALTKRLADRVERWERSKQAARFLAVVGASGSGKSSVVQAGLVPELKDRGHDWQFVTIRPGDDPLFALASELTSELENSLKRSEQLSKAMGKDKTTLHKMVTFLLKKAWAGKTAVLLIVDQFEELFTSLKGSSEDQEAQRVAFIDNLLYAAQAMHGALRLVLTFRADFYEALAPYDDLRRLIGQHQEYIGSISDEELREIVEEPARKAGYQVQEGLAELIIQKDLGDTDGQRRSTVLPLLSHALLKTWERRRYYTLMLEDYLAAGGVNGALQATADLTYNEMSAAEQALAQSLFIELTELGRKTADTRRRRSLSELKQGHDAALFASVQDKLTQARLIVVDDQQMAQDNTAYADIAHDALIREWDMLRNWLDSGRANELLLRDLQRRLEQWKTNKRSSDFLLRGAELENGETLLASYVDRKYGTERKFVQLSRDVADASERKEEEERKQKIKIERARTQAERLAKEEAQRREKYTQRALVAILILIVLVGGATAFAFFQRSELQQIEEQEQKRQQALALAQAAKSPQDFVLNLLLAIKSYDLLPSFEAYDVIRQEIDLASGGFIEPVHIDNAKLIGWHPEKPYLIARLPNEQSYIWDVANLERPLLPLPKSAAAVRWNQAGSQMLTSSYWHSTGVVQIWELPFVPSSEPLLTLPEEAAYAEWSPNGARIAAFQNAAESLMVNIWNVGDGESPQLEKRLTIIDQEHLFWSDDGSKLLTMDSQGQVQLWDVNDFSQPVTVWPLLVDRVSANADLSRVVTESRVPTHSQEMLIVWDSANLSQLFHSEHNWLDALWSPDKSQFYFIEREETELFSVIVVDSGTGEVIRRFPTGSNANWLSSDIFWVENVQTTTYVDAESWEIIATLDDSDAFIDPNDLQTAIIRLSRNYDYSGWTGNQQYWWGWDLTREDGISYEINGSVEVWNQSGEQQLYSFDNVRFTNIGSVRRPDLFWLNNGKQVVVQKQEGLFVYLVKKDEIIEQACLTAGRNLTWEEWETYFPSEEHYRRTCEKLEIHPSVADGFLRQNLAQFESKLNSWRRIDLDTAESMEEQLPKRIDFIIETAVFKQQFEEARTIYDFAASYTPPLKVSPYVAVELCIGGSLFGNAQDFVQICDDAVQQEPNDVIYVTGRAIARGLAGDFAGSLDDTSEVGCSSDGDFLHRNDLLDNILYLEFFDEFLSITCSQWIEAMQAEQTGDIKSQLLANYAKSLAWELYDPAE